MYYLDQESIFFLFPPTCAVMMLLCNKDIACHFDPFKGTKCITD